MLLYQGPRSAFQSIAHFKRTQYPKHAIRNMVVTVDEKTGTTRIEGDLVALPLSTIQRVKRIRLGIQRRRQAQHTRSIRRAIAG